MGILAEAVILPNGERHYLDAMLVDTNAGAGTDVNEAGQFKGSGHDRRDTLETGGGAAGGMPLGRPIGGGPGGPVGGAPRAAASARPGVATHRPVTRPARSA